MIVMSFDLSSACIGVTTARLNKIKEVEKIMSCPIIPKQFSPTELGYMASKKSLPTIKGNKSLNTYWKKGEAKITETEKKRRDREVRAKKDIFVLEYIGQQMGSMINKIKPDLIIVEKNAAFNGILTTVLLAKVYGTLLGIAGMLSIPVLEYSVNEVRAPYDVARLVSQFCATKTPEELKKLPDITKAAIRKFLYKIYRDKGINFQTDDESDSCLVFHYWYENIYKGGI
jgi:hypothetical protein